MTSKEKYLKRIAGQETDAIKEAKERIDNRSWLRESKKLALKILIRLDELNWSQRILSVKLEVTPQYVNKLLKGNEKFGFDILVKLQDVLSMSIFADYEDKKETLLKPNITTVKSANGILVERNTDDYKASESSTKYDAPIIPLFPQPSKGIGWDEIKEN
ncbi:helix-turn-helix transcriptional regulator [Chryseobacterium sp.]|uniref:helix-turn-helix transcriptional regulator n=1 Tax=Chryseobacterium sp. TaxID=1871047 RepID=UPI0031E1EB78